MAAQVKRHAEEMNTLKRQTAEDIAKMKSHHETMMERQRSEYENQINSLEFSLRECQQTIVKLESTVLELNTILSEKIDVEKQRDMWKAHHDSMEASKRDL